MTATPDLGSLLRRWRARAGLTQFELASLAAISTRHLSFIETGRARPSGAVADRLADGLRLSLGDADDLRLAAGHAPALSPLGSAVFNAAAKVDAAPDLSTMLDVSRTMLTRLGVRQFFFGRIGTGGTRTMRWSNPGTFPGKWLRRYDAQRYACVDPLLAAARVCRHGFFWREATEAVGLNERARRMFEEAATGGIVSGFVLPLHRGDGTIDFVSMMGDPAPDDFAVRLGLQTIGQQMLLRMERIRGALPGR